MTPRIWMEVTIVFVLWTFFLTILVWKLGVHNGEKWERYRWQVRGNIDDMPYSGMFENEAGAGEPLIVHHVKRGINGHWTED